MDFKVKDVLIGDSTFSDFEIENNDLAFVYDTDEIRQRLIANYRTYLGEWFLDISIGVPWFQSIFKKSTRLNVVGDILKDVALKSTGILEILKFNLDFDAKTRVLSVFISCRARTGEILNINETFG